MNHLIPRRKGWIEQTVERKLEKIADDPNSTRETKEAAQKVLKWKRLLEQLICWCVRGMFM